MIYLDNNVAARLTLEVAEAMKLSLAGDTRSIVHAAQESVAALVGADINEIFFTSGGSESTESVLLNALGLNPSKKHIVTTRVEHEAIRKLFEKLEINGYRVTWLDVDSDGLLDLAEVEASLFDETALVSVNMANSETGVISPVKEIAEIVKAKSGALICVDGENAAGKIAIDLKNTEIDLFSISADKFHGPKGVGALYVRDGINVRESEHIESVELIAGIGAAAKFIADLSPMSDVSKLRDELENTLLSTIKNTSVNGSRHADKRLPNTSNISFENTNGEMILFRLADAGIRVTTGSACNSADHTSSPTLSAMNVPYSKAMGSICFSLGRFTTQEEILRVIKVLPGIIANLSYNKD